MICGSAFSRNIVHCIVVAISKLPPPLYNTQHSLKANPLKSSPTTLQWAMQNLIKFASPLSLNSLTSLNSLKENRKFKKFRGSGVISVWALRSTAGWLLSRISYGSAGRGRIHNLGVELQRRCAGLTLLGKGCLIGERSHVSGGKKAEGNGCASSLVNSYSLLLLLRL